ncbi:hypothetical protein HO173_006329 [Letharia columbiana]|uniref:Beta-lactamase-related domain-containing protein n=1 Tax=Letharia columbiana TaxID=112416 RepID=A0A8H6FVW4_9LECA|nr:uncharacterized protein HO173_006329 [Letharia columbiana]KAF6235646.1 hypothetical protein HO173_006329 [Letharia columbiana]
MEFVEEAAYRDACASGALPGVIFLAADKEGTFEYGKAMGRRSTKPEDAAKAIEPDMVLAMAACTKLMTAITVLQCVERGLFDLDEDITQSFRI